MRRLGGLLAWAAVAMTLLIPATASGLTSDAQRLLSMINQERARAGLVAVSADASLSSLAQAHAEQLALAGRLFHNAAFEALADSAGAGGENVGRGPTVDEVHRAFMASATHRAVTLNTVYTKVGIGVAAGGDGVWVAEDFLGGSAPAAPPPNPAPEPAPAVEAAPPASPAPPQASPAPAPKSAPAAPATERPRRVRVAEAAAPEPPSPPARPPRVDRAMYNRMVRWETIEMALGATSEGGSVGTSEPTA